MELNVYFRPLKRWWWLLLLSTVLAIASSYWYVSQQPSSYEAVTTLIIGQAVEAPDLTGNDVNLSVQLAETYADLAQRQPVRDRTMAALELTSLPEYIARPLPNRQMIEIVVIDTVPERAQAVADELAKQLVLESPTAPDPEEQEQEAFINRQLASLRENIEQTESDISAKQAELETTFSALEINEIQLEIEALQIKLESLQNYFAALLATTTEGSANSISVIEPANLPSRPNNSDKILLVVIASTLAFALAAGTAYLLEYLDDTVHTPEEVVRAKGVADLPTIPEFPSNGNGVPVLAHDAPLSPALDAFRALRTGLLAAMVNRPSKIFLITSAAPREGKSTVAANLAAVLAEGRKKVLLIDADLRRPMQHKLFNVAGNYGLGELLVMLEGHERPNGSGEMIERAIQKLQPGNLSLIAAGSKPVDGSRLLGSDAMKVLLQTVSQHVDYIVIDSPPLLAVADAYMLSTEVDGVILVAGVSSIPRKQVEQALNRLNDVNARVVGVVLNRQKVGRDGYYYYQYYRTYTDQPNSKK